MAGFPGGKLWFFDSAAVLKAMDDASRRALSRQGAFVRTAARRSIRSRKAVSQPGSPPTNRTGLLKKLIYFAYDPARRGVVVGPVRFSGRGDGTAPALLEHGGTRPGTGKVVTFTNDPGRDAKTGKFVSNGKRRVRLDGTLTYRPRPFMGPAEAAERPRFAAQFKDSLRKAG